jgi:competence protein ComEC
LHSQQAALTAIVKTELTLLAFAAGVGLAQLTPELPSSTLSGTALFIATLLATYFLLREKSTRFAITISLALIIGASYALLRADLRMGDELPREWEGRDIELVGVIDELPQADAQGIRFAFDVERIITPNTHVPQRIALGWYKASVKELQGEPLPTLHHGERWQLIVRLKRPHGYVNPAGFDVEAWLLENNLRATGSVRGDEPNRRLTENAGRVSDQIGRVREKLRDRMKVALENQRYGGVLIALALGDQRAISESDWTMFNATAVSHLLSISGAHVTLFAGWIAWLVFALWRRSPRLIAIMPAQKAAAIAAAIVAVLYAALSGFAVPAQRTCYMLLAAAFALMLNRALSVWLILCGALVLVLVIDPWAVLAVGFWFSFCAVAMLLYVTTGRVPTRPWWHTVFVTQAAITLGLAPLTIALFQQVSLVGPIANAIAIPLITLLVIPLTLIWLVLQIDGLLMAAHQLIVWLAQFLQWLLSFPAPSWVQHAPPWWVVALACAGSLLILMPRAGRGVWALRALGIVWCVPMFTVTPATPIDGEFRITTLDIGQGTAVVIRTTNHTLVYDTGPRWTDASDAGSRIIAPYLRASGSSRISALVVSHLDIDHSGGARSLLLSTSIDWMMTSVFAEAEIVKTAKQKNVDVLACQSGQNWMWDNVRFEVLHPNPDNYANAKLKTNDRSCVIKVIGNGGSILLTADIETPSERALVVNNATALKADVLLIPHHGSMTSSTPEFIEAVSPKLALINAGYRNRFGHPRDAVLARYEDKKIPVYRTDWHGAVILYSIDGFTAIEKTRETRKRYWVDRPDPKDVRPIE